MRTPHQGTQYADYARAMALRLDRLGSNPDIFLPLQTNSTSLQLLHKDFMQSFNELHMANIYEARKLVICPKWVWYDGCRIMVREQYVCVMELSLKNAN